MQILQTPAKWRKLDSYAAAIVHRSQKQWGGQRLDKNEGVRYADLFIPTMTGEAQVGRRGSRPWSHKPESWLALRHVGTHASSTSVGKKERISVWRSSFSRDPCGLSRA